MGVEIKFSGNGVGVELHAFGVVHGREIIKANIEIYHPKHLRKQKYKIIDKSKCTEYNVSAKDIEFIAELDKEASLLNPRLLIAIIESKSLQFSLTGLWQAYVEGCGFNTKSFRDRHSALDWIAENLKSKKIITRPALKYNWLVK